MWQVGWVVAAAAQSTRKARGGDAPVCFLCLTPQPQRTESDGAASVALLLTLYTSSFEATDNSRIGNHICLKSDRGRCSCSENMATPSESSCFGEDEVRVLAEEAQVRHRRMLNCGQPAEKSQHSENRDVNAEPPDVASDERRHDESPVDSEDGQASLSYDDSGSDNGDAHGNPLARTLGNVDSAQVGEYTYLVPGHRSHIALFILGVLCGVVLSPYISVTQMPKDSSLPRTKPQQRMPLESIEEVRLKVAHLTESLNETRKTVITVRQEKEQLSKDFRAALATNAKLCQTGMHQMYKMSGAVSSCLRQLEEESAKCARFRAEAAQRRTDNGASYTGDTLSTQQQKTNDLSSKDKTTAEELAKCRADADHLTTRLAEINSSHHVPTGAQRLQEKLW